MKKVFVFGMAALLMLGAVSCERKEAADKGVAAAGKAASALEKALKKGDAAAFSEALATAGTEALAALTETSASPGGDFTYDLNEAGDGIIIKQYTGTNPILVIPAQIEGYPVVQVGNGNRLDGRKSYRPSEVDRSSWDKELMDYTKTIPAVDADPSFLVSVVFPASVQYIRGYAFADNNTLQTVVLPESPPKIGCFSTFTRCTALYNMVIPDNITALQFGAYDKGEWKVYDPDTFKGCGKLSLATRQRLKDLGYTGNF